MGDRVTSHATCEPGRRVLTGELCEHIAGCGKAHGMAAAERVLGDVLHDHRLADAVRAHKDGILAAFDERQAEQLLDRLAVDLLGPGPIEVDHGFCGADVGVTRASLESTFLTLALFDVEDFTEPRLVDDLVAAGDEAEQAERFEARPQLHRCQFNGHGCYLS
jgi:hypothetical protein